MKIFYLIIISLLLGTSVFSQPTILHGKVTEEKSGEELIYTSVLIFQNGKFITSCSSDFNGDYSLVLDPGIYDMKITYTGYTDRLISGIVIEAEQKDQLDIPSEKEGGQIQNDLISQSNPMKAIKLDVTISINLEPEVIDTCNWKTDLIEKTEAFDIQKINSEDIRNRANKEVKQIISNMAGVSINNF